MKRESATALRRGVSIAAAALLLGATFAPVDADARVGRGGSFGSRGSKTFSAPPPTATMPGVAPIQRSTTAQPGPSFGNNAAAAQQGARRGGFFGGGLGAGLMGGLLGAGLFGLLSGSGLFGGLGSLSSLFGLLIQGVLIFFVVKLVMGWFARRREGQQPAAASGPSPYSLNRDRDPVQASSSGGSGFGRNFGFGGGQASVEPLTLDKADFDVFERRLGEIQAAWSAQDIERMRSLATPEVVQDFAEDLADDASRGVVNRVTDVKLLQGDLAEAWREGARDYATVAMRYGLIDVTEDRATGRVVDGDPSRPTEAAESWTFVRAGGGNWLLSAIQQAA